MIVQSNICAIKRVKCEPLVTEDGVTLKLLASLRCVGGVGECVP